MSNARGQRKQSKWLQNHVWPLSPKNSTEFNHSEWLFTPSALPGHENCNEGSWKISKTYSHKHSSWVPAKKKKKKSQWRRIALPIISEQNGITCKHFYKQTSTGTNLLVGKYSILLKKQEKQEEIKRSQWCSFGNKNTLKTVKNTPVLAIKNSLFNNSFPQKEREWEDPTRRQKICLLIMTLQR